ncbi:hypothetical protein CERZMDRAFT_90454 [Cercospora zeae-maydis SCOH1-5]|uniref:Uncharacterized protein n=1 Tax=Cercospora zeae-maydis SCOH1-5 TaxID=717836 RepID=A0A6A6FJ04_9PEZI|nr:hypothetical protein CERZMDRAFT_90454 [Cercospora zeae-maydis SCOH1-5]
MLTTLNIVQHQHRTRNAAVGRVIAEHRQPPLDSLKSGTARYSQKPESQTGKAVPEQAATVDEWLELVPSGRSSNSKHNVAGAGPVRKKHRVVRNGSHVGCRVSRLEPCNDGAAS